MKNCENGTLPYFCAYPFSNLHEHCLRSFLPFFYSLCDSKSQRFMIRTIKMSPFLSFTYTTLLALNQTIHVHKHVYVIAICDTKIAFRVFSPQFVFVFCSFSFFHIFDTNKDSQQFKRMNETEKKIKFNFLFNSGVHLLKKTSMW